MFKTWQRRLLKRKIDSILRDRQELLKVQRHLLLRNEGSQERLAAIRENLARLDLDIRKLQDELVALGG